ncbi:MAG TPA: TerC family protein [Burkholderiales bacterium]|nr:TerC family protein [Burkholderiales bacterium]
MALAAPEAVTRDAVTPFLSGLAEFVQDGDFWLGLLEIIGVNIVLSGDNAVVIALAARSLPRRQQRAAIAFGSGAAIILRVLLTTMAARVLALPWLKLGGSLLLFWIGVQLLLPEEPDHAHAGAPHAVHLVGAVRIILVADLVMSLDNVLAVAAAAQGSMLLLVLGLALSIPLIVFGSTAILRLMERFPAVITFGAGLLGYVAGDMLMSEQVLETYSPPAVLDTLVPWIGAFGVIATGRWIAARRARAGLAPRD